MKNTPYNSVKWPIPEEVAVCVTAGAAERAGRITTADQPAMVAWLGFLK